MALKFLSFPHAQTVFCRVSNKKKITISLTESVQKKVLTKNEETSKGGEWTQREADWTKSKYTG